MSSPQHKQVYSPLGSAASIPLHYDQQPQSQPQPQLHTDDVQVHVREEKNTPRNATHDHDHVTGNHGSNDSVGTTKSFKDETNNKDNKNGGNDESSSSTGEWVKKRVAPTRRSQFFWLFGALLAIIWTVAIFARAVAVSKYVYCNGVTCWNDGNSSYAATTLGWVVLAFSLVGVIAGFVIAFQYSDRSVGAWFRLREHHTIRKQHTRNHTNHNNNNNNTTNSDIEHGNGSNDSSVDPISSPRYEQSKDNIGRSILLAFVPFGITFAILGVWFGFHIGAVAALLSVDVSTIEKWAFSMCTFAMLFIMPIMIILSWIDRLAPLLAKMDDALIDWSSNDGLAPLGRLIIGIARGIAISGWFALLGVLIGTCIGLPAMLMGGIGLAILILALVIVIIAVWYFHKRAQSPPSTPRRSSTTVDEPSTHTSAAPSTAAPTGNKATDAAKPSTVAATCSSGGNDSGVVSLQSVVVTPKVTNTPTPTPMIPPVYETPHDTHGVISPHNDNGNDNGAILIHTSNANTNNTHSHGSNDGEVLYLRGLALLNGNGGDGNGNDNGAAASSLIIQSAEMGYAPAQEHLRQLLMKQSSKSSAMVMPTATTTTASSSSTKSI